MTAAKIGATLGFERIHSDGRDNPCGSPAGIDFSRHRAGFRPSLRRREVLELLDQDVGTNRARSEERTSIGAGKEQPASTKRRRPATIDKRG
jgi:hypothetical protein